ncbi:MAG: c-type cytochrome [Bacteroidota bacterium]|nr:c-type cytochrome [Bacteroidota bacterium]
MNINKHKTLIIISLLSLFLYISAFKNPLASGFFKSIEGDSSYFKLSNEQKRKPENALSGLIVNDSLKANLFASEPMLTNPTDIDVDAKGRVWICEGFNYRPMHNPGAKVKGAGDRILILEDTDGDNVADKQKVFFQGPEVNAALGICVLGNKVIISCSPEIFILTDENGDDEADKKEVLFKGIGGFQHDHAVHAVVFGPDGKLYFNYGNEGGKLLDKNGNQVIDKYGNTVSGKGKAFKQGMIFRCNFDGSEVEVLAHNFRNNYEVAVDAFGNLWQSDNDDDGNKAVRINYVMEFGNYGYQDEITGAGWQSYRNNMETEIPRRHWHQNDPGVVPNMLITGAGSPTGIIVYEGTRLPKGFHNQVIHTDAGPKVVRAYPIQPDGAGYKATIKNLVEGRDDWFRPSDLTVAPDGSLIVADWYDPGVGGHQRGDLDQGRIFKVDNKVVPNGKYAMPDFSKLDQAAEALASPNMATRYLAWDQLKKQGAKSEKYVSALLKSPNPRVRARAYWFLSKLDGIGQDYIKKALNDADINVKIAAIKMARQSFSDPIPVISSLIKLNNSSVNRELAIATRYAPLTDASIQLLVDLAMNYKGNDRWYLEALGIGSDTHPDEFFKAWKSKIGDNWNNEVGRDIIWRTRSTEVLPYYFKIMSDPNTSINEINKFFRALDFQKEGTPKSDLLLKLLDVEGPNKNEILRISVNAMSAFDIQRSAKLRDIVYNRLQLVKGTAEYLQIVGKFQLKDQASELYNIIVTHPEKPMVQNAMKSLVAVDGLNLIKECVKTKPINEQIKVLESMIYTESKEVLEFKVGILTDDKISNDVKKAVINSFSWGWDGQDYLLEFVRKGKLPKALEPAIANLFINADRPVMREEAAKLIKMPEMNEKPLPSINQLSLKKGNVENGILVYKKNCMTCHMVNGKGVDFGPGLSEIGSKFGRDGLYMAILMPDAGVSFGYEGYIIKKKEGGGGAGIIISETEADLDLKMMGGTITSFKKSEIADKKKMEKSLMPSLYGAMTEQELVDLVEYLTTLKKIN